MTTLNQLIKQKNPFFSAMKKKMKRSALASCPQKKGTCIKVFEISPKKPNSAKRKVAKICLTSTKRTIICYIPGEGHSLMVHSIVLIHGGRAQDLPGVKYQIIRGKFDCSPVKNRKTSISIYGKNKSKTNS